MPKSEIKKDLRQALRTILFLKNFQIFLIFSSHLFYKIKIIFWLNFFKIFATN